MNTLTLGLQGHLSGVGEVMAKAEQTRYTGLKVIYYSLVCLKKQSHNEIVESLKRPRLYILAKKNY
jgi:hypothetical protein